MNDLLIRETRAPVVGVDVDARRVTVRLCRWNDPRTVNDSGRVHREAIPPGGLTLADDVSVVDQHFGNLIGRADTTTFRDDGDGPTVELVLARTTAGSDTLALIEADVIRSVSMEFRPDHEHTRDDGVIERRGTVHGVAFAFRPAHAADILATRESTTEQETPAMTTTTATADPVDVLPDDPADITVTAGQLTRSLDELRDDLTRTLLVDRPDPGALVSAADRFRSFGDYALAAYADPDDPMLRRALVDQITTDNPGVVPPAWLSEVEGIVDRGSPTITAFGRTPLPSTGMTIEWPYYAGSLADLVAEQTTEKSEIQSVKVSLERGSEAIHTFAGGSDISYQLIRRSDPAYLSAYLRIMSAAYSLVTDQFAADAVMAAATQSSVSYPGGDYAALVGALVVASTEVEAATGAPASFALAATDVFVAAASAAAVANAASPNVSGGSNIAATLSVSASGLPVIHDPQLPNGALIVSNGQAGTWYSEGPFTVTAEDVEKLGQNVAVWGMGAMGMPAAAGIINAGTVVAATSSKSASK